MRFCDTCGARLVFVEVGLPGKTKEAKQRHDAAVAAHTQSQFRCKEAQTFLGAELLACRCEARKLIQREDGLWCAQCDGLVAPEVAPPQRRDAEAPQ
jgi:hypothetical protein